MKTKDCSGTRTTKPFELRRNSHQTTFTEVVPNFSQEPEVAKPRDIVLTIARPTVLVLLRARATRVFSLSKEGLLTADNRESFVMITFGRLKPVWGSFLAIFHLIRLFSFNSLADLV